MSILQGSASLSLIHVERPPHADGRQQDGAACLPVLPAVLAREAVAGQGEDGAAGGIHEAVQARPLR